jgi:hypothetical protein
VLHALEGTCELPMCREDADVQHTPLHPKIALDRPVHLADPSCNLPRQPGRNPLTGNHDYHRWPIDTISRDRRGTGASIQGDAHYGQPHSSGAWAALIAVLVAMTIGSATARADGARPGEPYHYLHPPKYLRDINQLPRPVTRSFSVGSLKSGLWFAFTHDGQAGLSSSTQPFAAPASVTAVQIHIAPVETPGTLPDTLYSDGNAYRITAIGQPGNVQLGLARPLQLTLRFPRLPHGIEIYRDGSWTSLCTLRGSTYTSQTINCPTTELGTVLAVVVGPTRRHATSPSLTRRWPIVAGVIFIVLAIVVVVILVRRVRRSTMHAA